MIVAPSCLKTPADLATTNVEAIRPQARTPQENLPRTRYTRMSTTYQVPLNSTAQGIMPTLDQRSFPHRHALCKTGLLNSNNSKCQHFKDNHMEVRIVIPTIMGVDLGVASLEERYAKWGLFVMIRNVLSCILIT